jgi:hypothetical protein
MGERIEPADLRVFVRESNRIEGIHRAPTLAELRAHGDLLALPTLSVGDVERFVAAVARKPLRRHPGMNVRVGNHIAPSGGPEIEASLAMILDNAMAGVDPWRTHVSYETLHPFLDGNGRSGRAIWLWQMINQHQARHALSMGFLHLFYYQTLANSGGRRA